MLRRSSANSHPNYTISRGKPNGIILWKTNAFRLWVIYSTYPLSLTVTHNHVENCISLILCAFGGISMAHANACWNMH